jgi:hypothetical protein
MTSINDLWAISTTSNLRRIQSKDLTSQQAQSRDLNWARQHFVNKVMKPVYLPKPPAAGGLPRDYDDNIAAWEYRLEREAVIAESNGLSGQAYGDFVMGFDVKEKLVRNLNALIREQSQVFDGVTDASKFTQVFKLFNDVAFTYNEHLIDIKRDSQFLSMFHSKVIQVEGLFLKISDRLEGWSSMKTYEFNSYKPSNVYNYGYLKSIVKSIIEVCRLMLESKDTTQFLVSSHVNEYSQVEYQPQIGAQGDRPIDDASSNDSDDENDSEDGDDADELEEAKEEVRDRGHRTHTDRAFAAAAESGGEPPGAGTGAGAGEGTTDDAARLDSGLAIDDLYAHDNVKQARTTLRHVKETSSLIDFNFALITENSEANPGNDLMARARENAEANYTSLQSDVREIETIVKAIEKNPTNKDIKRMLDLLRTGEERVNEIFAYMNGLVKDVKPASSIETTDTQPDELDESKDIFKDTKAIYKKIVAKPAVGFFKDYKAGVINLLNSVIMPDYKKYGVGAAVFKDPSVLEYVRLFQQEYAKKAKVKAKVNIYSGKVAPIDKAGAEFGPPLLNQEQFDKMVNVIGPGLDISAENLAEIRSKFKTTYINPWQSMEALKMREAESKETPTQTKTIIGRLSGLKDAVSKTLFGAKDAETPPPPPPPRVEAPKTPAPPSTQKKRGRPKGSTNKIKSPTKGNSTTFK